MSNQADSRTRELLRPPSLLLITHNSLLITVVLFLGPCCARCADLDDEPEEDTIPQVGRPPGKPFSEASGEGFKPSARAEPTTLAVETPLTLTLTVRATAPVRRPPQRIDLRKMAAVEKHFYIEDPTDGSGHPDARTWEFLYRLRPRRTDVTEIPSIPFVFYNPVLGASDPASGFQTLYTAPIPLQVRPAPVVEVPLQAPDSAFELATGPALLAHRAPWQPPGLATCLAVLLTPPLLCGLWYLCWKRLYPDAARRAHERRSRAARAALHELRGAGRLPPEQQAALAVHAVAGYLHERLGLGAAEPTAAETADHLRRHGCSAELTESAARFFRACDEARFLPAPPTAAADLSESAARLILAVEEESCSSPHS
jgi:hypothetical protein